MSLCYTVHLTTNVSFLPQAPSLTVRIKCKVQVRLIEIHHNLFWWYLVRYICWKFETQNLPNIYQCWSFTELWRDGAHPSWHQAKRLFTSSSYGDKQPNILKFSPLHLTCMCLDCKNVFSSRHFIDTAEISTWGHQYPWTWWNSDHYPAFCLWDDCDKVFTSGQSDMLSQLFSV